MGKNKAQNKAKTEHSIQREFFAGIGVMCRHGIDVAILWAQSKEDILKRPLGSEVRRLNPDLPLPTGNELFETSWIHAIPNGGFRDAITAGKLKAEGVRSGVGDVFVPLGRKGWNGFYLEFKTPGGRQQDTQKAFEEYCSKVNYLYAISKSAEDALKKLKWYLS